MGSFNPHTLKIHTILLTFFTIITSSNSTDSGLD